MSEHPDLLKELEPRLGNVRGRLSASQPLSAVTWFRVGGPAQVLFQPADEEDLAEFLRNLPDEIPVLTVGLGSNLLIRDGGVEGVVIRLGAKGFGTVETLNETQLQAGTATPDKRVAEAAAKAGIGGFAFYAGIPGALGGALRMNAGAHGSETCQHLVELRAIDRQGNLHLLKNEDMGYSYRHSSASQDLIFTSAILEGVPAPETEIREAMAAVAAQREASQPVREKTGGSTFKNPEGQSAWKLIDAAGCRGLQIGGARMSDMHCNFMINTGEATALDLETLGETVRRRVRETQGVTLEWEIKRLGLFGPAGEVVPFAM